MRAVLCKEFGSHKDLVVDDVPPLPDPGPGQVKIAVAAAGLNFADLLMVGGRYQEKPALPFSPGLEAAGRVIACGPGVTRVAPGDRVLALLDHGAFAEQALARETDLHKLPADMDDPTAAGFAIAYGTAHGALRWRAELQPGETVLILGAAGGVGTAAIQIAKAAGARVIAAASSDEKCARCREIGADATINYATGSLRDEIKALTDGKGPDIIYDPVGGDLAEAAFRSIGWRGRYLVVGFAQGSIPALPLNLALLKGASLVGVFWGEFAKREPKRNAAMMMALAQWYAAGKIRPVIDQVLPMEQLPQAFARMASRQVVGKLVVVNG